MKYGVILTLIFGTVLAGFGVYALFLAVGMIRDGSNVDEPMLGIRSLIFLLIAIVAFACAAVLLFWASNRNKRNG
jgi:predicted Co/Zn/Cd cation transporter (cation efflux family)